MSDGVEYLTLRAKLEHFGDANEIGDWKSGEADYVSRLGLTAADVPELIAIARQWAERFDGPDDKKDVTRYAPVHAWRCLGQLRAAEAVGPLLALMDALDKSGDDWFVDEFFHVFGLMGPPAFAPLREYLLDSSHGLYPRNAAADGLVKLAQRQPELRSQVIESLCQTLSDFRQNDQLFNGFIVASLLDAKATEAAEVIERAFAEDYVDISVIGNWNMVRKELGVPGLGLVPEELASMGWEWIRESSPDRDHDGDQDDDSFMDRPPFPDPTGRYEPEPEYQVEQLRSAKQAGRNDPCPCGSGKKFKKCCGQ